MKYLLDTSVLLHSLISRSRLNARALRLLSEDSPELYLSAVSPWEMAIKAATGRLVLPERTSQVIERATRLMSLKALDITHVHALAVEGLPNHHRDPFDRMLIAQASVERMILLTADRIFEDYGIDIIFCGS
ncbi:MAG: type II toxin-antitoxin system VapC family toxin [Candidatus Acidiferrum sp.]